MTSVVRRGRGSIRLRTPPERRPESPGAEGGRNAWRLRARSLVRSSAAWRESSAADARGSTRIGGMRPARGLILWHGWFPVAASRSRHASVRWGSNPARSVGRSCSFTRPDHSARHAFTALLPPVCGTRPCRAGRKRPRSAATPAAGRPGAGGTGSHPPIFGEPSGEEDAPVRRWRLPAQYRFTLVPVVSRACSPQSPSPTPSLGCRSARYPGLPASRSIPCRARSTGVDPLDEIGERQAV